MNKDMKKLFVVALIVVTTLSLQQAEMHSTRKKMDALVIKNELQVKKIEKLTSEINLLRLGNSILRSNLEKKKD
jgi:ribosomal protein S3AE